MFGNAHPAEENLSNGEDQTEEQLQQNPYITVSIPKLEPYCPSSSETNEDVSDDGELMATPIPFTTPYKVRDPIVLLEKCDKIWETLQLIKNVQASRSSYDTFNALPSEIRSQSLYVKYQPVLGNDNAALPNFQFCVKNTKKLFYCSTCGRQYTNNRTLRYHSERVHGIYIPPKRINNAIVIRKNIDKEKDFNEAAKEKSSFEKIDLKKNENKLCTDALLEPMPAQITEPNHLNFQSQRKRRSVSTRDGKNVTASETVTNEQEKEVSHKEFRENEKPHSVRHDSVSQQCTLCKKLVRDVKKHLTDYHKIDSPDFMLKEIEKTSAISQIKELERVYINNESSKKYETTQESSFVPEDSAHYRGKRKRKSKVLDAGDCKKGYESYNRNTFQEQGLHGMESRQCNICLGTYSVKSYPRHLRTHHERGETKKNFHLFYCNYWNSPLYVKANANPSDLSSECTSDHKDTNEDTMVCKQDKKKGKKEKSPLKYKRRKEYICSCGRTFRNPHTLFMHKRKCNFQNEELELFTQRDKLNAPGEDVTRNNCERNSGIGISITIKKKNNSYEVVGKDGDNENKLNINDFKDTDASSDTSDDSSQEELQDSYEILELSKYSKNHSILKIELVDEDVDVDIEEDSQNSPWNNNINDRLTTDKIKNDFATKDETVEQPLETEREKDKAIGNTELENTDKKHICVCGSGFSTSRALDVHVNEHYQSAQLICGYCKEAFPDVDAWNKHQCSIREGKMFVDLPMQLNCYQCSAVLHTYKKFDEHVRLKHFDSVVSYQCFHCYKRFSNPTARQCHLRADHGTSVCSLCKAKCSDIMRPRHEGYHYGLGFPCHVCKKTYTNKFNLSSHRGKVHPKISTYSIICDNCKSCFSNVKELKIHTKDGACRKSSRTSKKTEVES